MQLKDKVAIITGAGTGIGKAIAEKFAQNGAKVIINYNNSEKEATILLDSLLKQGFIVDKFKADLSKEEDIKNLISFSIKRFEGIDILVNNAGIVFDKNWNEKTSEEWNKTLNINLIASFLTTKYSYQYLNKSKSGRIINISSTNATNTYSPFSMDYDASKAGLVSLTKNLSVALSPNVLVNAILPGWISTDMNKYLPNDFLNSEKEKILVKRFGTSEEIANVALFLASDKASYINGSIIDVNGGYQ